MEIDKALEQLEEIHHHVSHSEVYRGYRSALTAFVGVIALAAAFLQPRLVDPTHPLSFVHFWVVVATVNALFPLGYIFFRFFAYESSLERQKTRRAVGQFIPCVLAGAILTFSVCRTDEAFIVFLPGLWSFLFGMGIYASKPHLPSSIQWMATSFFAGGTILLALIPQGLSLSPWGMGLNFGLGMFIGAFVLYFNIERKSHEAQK